LKPIMGGPVVHELHRVERLRGWISKRLRSNGVRRVAVIDGGRTLLVVDEGGAQQKIDLPG
jgi:hypothetical protein